MLRVYREQDRYVVVHEDEKRVKSIDVAPSAADDIRRLANEYTHVFECINPKIPSPPPLFLKDSIDIDFYSLGVHMRVNEQILQRASMLAIKACHEIKKSTDGNTFRSSAADSLTKKHVMSMFVNHSVTLNGDNVCSDVSFTVPVTPDAKRIYDCVRNATADIMHLVTIGSTLDDIHRCYCKRLAAHLDEDVSIVASHVPFSVVNRIGSKPFVTASTGLLLPGQLVSVGPNYKIQNDEYILDRRPYLVTFTVPYDITRGEYDKTRTTLT